jgi:hypothetical protein
LPPAAISFYNCKSDPHHYSAGSSVEFVLRPDLQC